MTIYVRWPIEDDATFRDAYLAETGEGVGKYPLENESGTHFMIGSSRVTLAQAANLQTNYPNVEFLNEWPSDWIPKQDEML